MNEQAVVPEASEESPNVKWIVLATVIFGTFLGRLDQTVVGLALPKIITDFNITVTSAAWISTAYILANAIFVPVWGKLGDTAGRKRIYLIGFIGFTVASGLCAIAWSLSSMIVFRIIQGFAVSADYPTAMAIISVTFHDGKQRAQALGIWSGAFAVAAVFGPLIGGPLIDTFGWRSVFLINIPLGILGLILALRYISESVGERKNVKFDWFGSLTLGATLATLVLVLDQGQTWGWISTWSLVCYAGTLLFGVLFFIIERRQAEPIVNLNFFKIPTFVYTLLNNFIVFMALMGAIFLIPIFAETFLGYTATQTGYLFIPLAICMMIAAPLGGRLIGKVKPSYVIFASTFLSGVGIFLLSYIDPRSTAIDIALPMSIMAAALGFGMAQRTNLVAVAVPKDDIGEASAVLALVRNIAGAFGLAVFSTILDHAINANVLATARNSILHVVSPANLQQFIALIELKAQVAGYATVFEIASIVVMLGSFTALLIQVPRDAITKEHQVVAEG
jgi:DHA2 family multidrug resistance protein